MISEYLATNNQEILDVVKEYCKNDVKLTLFVLLYIFRYKELSFDGEKYDITVEQFVDLSKQSDIKNLTEKKDMSQNNIFIYYHSIIKFN
jgi:hypothetical protein